MEIALDESSHEPNDETLQKIGHCQLSQISARAEKLQCDWFVTDLFLSSLREDSIRSD